MKKYIFNKKKILTLEDLCFLKLDLFAEHKGTKSSKNGRDSKSKRLGIKINHGESVKSGGIIIKQRGTRFFPGKNVFLSKDHSIHSFINGTVYFKRKKKYGKNKFYKIVNVEEHKIKNSLN